VVLTGPSTATAVWRAELARRYRPDLLAIQLSDDTTDLPHVLAKPAGARAEAWVCRGPQCLPPIADIVSLVDRLSSANL
jgi:uncharacterized protein YyaL (SSP411 family)